MEARFYEHRDDKKVRCRLCPHNCLISPGKTGICRVRLNTDGTLTLPYYGKLSAVAVDPMEKKPLYHFFPGSSILSVGFVGCSFHCPFCQNFRISQSVDIPTQDMTPGQLVELARRNGAFALAYTYSEPLIHLEYILEAAGLARSNGIKNVLVSNGYINEEPAEELLGVLDAANIDFKGNTPEFYRRELGGELEEVKRFIRQAAGRIAIEVTTLVIPTRNDTEQEIEQMASFLAEIDPDIPYHLSCYFPTYKYSIPLTSPQAVLELAEHARKYLHYVYVGNAGIMENTNCPDCGRTLIDRRGYAVSFPGVSGGKCTKCGRRIAIPGLP